MYIYMPDILKVLFRSHNLGIVISILSGAYVIYRCVNNIIKDYKVNIGKAHEQERKARDEKIN